MSYLRSKGVQSWETSAETFVSSQSSWNLFQTLSQLNLLSISQSQSMQLMTSNTLDQLSSLAKAQFIEFTGSKTVSTMICPYHYTQLSYAVTQSIRLSGGGLKLTLFGLSLNAWTQAQRDFGTPHAGNATELMYRLTELPEPLQTRVIAFIFGEEPESFTASEPVTSVDERQSGKSYHSTGIHGFTERGAPAEYDVAAGSVIGYRGWQLTAGSHGSLTGAYGGEWPFPAHPGYQYTAVCRNSSRCGNVPNESNCGCGFWAYWTPEKAHPTTYSRDILGVIEGSGKVILGEHGFRSQYAVIRGLAIVSTSYRTEEELVQQLSWYHAPVYGNVSDLITTLGTDPVYSPDARVKSHLAGFSRRELESYSQVLSITSRIISGCDGPYTHVNTHSQLMPQLMQETSIVKDVLAHI
jgi:hypothetical protein